MQDLKMKFTSKNELKFFISIHCLTEYEVYLPIIEKPKKNIFSLLRLFSLKSTCNFHRLCTESIETATQTQEDVGTAEAIIYRHRNIQPS